MVRKLLNLVGDFLVANDWFTVKLLKYKGQSIRVVYYHMVAESEVAHYFPNKAISKKIFEEQVAFFKKHFNVVSLQEAVSIIDANKKRKKLLVISFDDGFKENYTEVLPILKKNNILSTFFIISNCIDNKDLMWRNKLLIIKNTEERKLHKAIAKTKEEFKLPDLKKDDDLMSWSLDTWSMGEKEDIVNFLWKETVAYTVSEYLETNTPYLTADQIRELKSEGHEIGSHSVSHPVFSKLTYPEFKNEIVTSSKIISELIAKDVHMFSYPFGRTASTDYEDRYRKEVDSKILFFGTKNNLKNNRLDSRWERDNAEHNHNMMLFRFAVLPIFRSLKK